MKETSYMSCIWLDYNSYKNFGTCSQDVLHHINLNNFVVHRSIKITVDIALIVIHDESLWHMDCLLYTSYCLFSTNALLKNEVP